MKKLMFATLLACAAAFSASAAEFQWGFTSDSSMLPDGSDYLDKGTALLYLGTVSFEGGAWKTDGATLLASGGMNADYTFGQLSTSGMPSSTSVDGAGGQAFTLILLSENSVSDLAGFVGDGKYYYAASGTSQSAYYMSGTDPVYYAMMLNSTAVTSWSEAKSDIPEPTSGLLLLVGGAMLALRRKRA